MPLYCMGIVPRNNSTGGVEVPSLLMSDSILGKRLDPCGEEDRRWETC